MLIGDLAKLTGLSKDGLRHYEAMGLIHSRQVRAGTRHYCHYDETTLERLELIALGKRLHFSLREIAELLNRLMRDQITREERSAIMLHKVGQIDQRIADLMAARQELIDLAGAPDKGMVDQRLKQLGLALK
jgi:DNA-binding transcriptional MerR regulator